MTKEELLIEAKKRYPIGTKFKGWSHCNEIAEVEAYYYSGSSIAVKERRGVVYHQNKWSKIISPKPELNKELINHPLYLL